MHNLIDGSRRHTNFSTQPILTDSVLFQELFQEYFAWMYVLQHDVPSVIVNDFYVTRRSVIPHEADPPLIIDPNAVLPTSITFQFLQPIRRRSPQIVNHVGCVKHLQLTASALLNFYR